MKYFLLLQFFLAAIFSAEGQTGIPVPQMTQSDAIIQNFLNTYGVPGATVAIARDGVIVYMRAFRYSDLA